MTVLSSVHTHTDYCDGESTVEEMVQSAIRMNVSTLGFSGHSPLFGEDAKSWTMSLPDVERYRRDIAAARRKYTGQIELLCGLELDIDTDPAIAEGFDFLIGSVHRLLFDNDTCSVDNTVEELDVCVAEHFGGDYYAYCAAYYEKLSHLHERTRCDIIGHFDLVSKFHEQHRRFDQSDPRYREPVFSCLEKLVQTGAVFEINTGGISRGFRSVPYPADWILREICRLGGSVLLSSDAHSASTLLFGFEEAAALAKDCGFKSVKALTARGFIDIPL